MNCFLQTVLLLLALLLPTTALAYDFAVDGIYYNKTSNNTVEVTYKDNNYASYSGTVTIPSSVTYNNVTYTVTAIGDSAFYASEDVSELTISETVTSIGEATFYGCHPHKMTCLAIEAPTLHNSFDNELDTEYYSFWRDWLNNTLSDDWSILYVNPEAFDNYYGWSQYFTEIVNGRSSTESIGYDTYARYSQYGGALLHGIVSIWGDGALYVINGGEWIDYCYVCDEGYGGIYAVDVDDAYDDYEGHIDVVIVEYGKLPSEVVQIEYSFLPYAPECYYDTEWSTYDFIVDGISYSFDWGVSVAPDVDIITHHPIDVYGNSDYTCLGLYQGHVTIPSTVTYNGYTYNVTGIDSYTFGNYGVYENYGQYYDYYAPYYGGEVQPRNLTGITIPNTVSYIGWRAFYACDNIQLMHLTGEGEWTIDGCLDVAVQRLDVASGITSLTGQNSSYDGLFVNPRVVYSYAAVPPTCDENTFTDYTGTLHVPESSLAAYFMAPYWCNFADIVGDAVELTGITISKDSAELLVGEQLMLTTAIQPNNASIDSIAWSSSNEAIATVVNGVVIAKGKGECDIVATALDKRAICHLTVNEVLPTSITLNQESIMMEKDSTFTLVATIAPENASCLTVTWTSSNEAIATVNSDGVITAWGEGECDITASCKGLTAVCHVKVLDRFIYITLDQHRAKLLPNHILTLTPTVTPVPTDLVVTSTNASVAAARLANGKVQVVGVAPGRAIIKVSSADGKAFADSCIVDVYTQVGDVNLDGFVKISDVTCMIDYLLGGNVSPFDAGNADMNYDGTVSISDITALIDYLLSGETAVSTYETFTVNGVSFSMVRVAGGTFMMGATEEQGDDASYWEIPAHQVTLTSSYMIGETEVTQELWQAVMGNNPSMHTGDLQKPVEYVTWPQCQEFIIQLNALTGQNFRLPTEAEWEFAARGGLRGHGYKYAGSNNVDDVAWYTGTTTHPVALLQPNELGLYDMSGNVDEWINDYWSMYTSEPQVDPIGPETGTNHPYRGGSWYGGATASRVSCRMYRSETFKRGTMGLRLAL